MCPHRSYPRAALVAALVAGAVAQRSAPAAGAVAQRSAPAAVAPSPPGVTALHFVSAAVGGTLGATEVRGGDLVLAAGPDPVRVTPAAPGRALPDALPPGGGGSGAPPALVAGGVDLPAPELDGGRRGRGPTIPRPAGVVRAPWRPG